MHECDNCKKHNLCFKRNYKPEDFIEGKINSYVWIVGLNPAASSDWVDDRSIADLEGYFNNLSGVHGYFNDFKSVSKCLYNNLGKDYGTAHTDLVKCSSLRFPPVHANGTRVTGSGVDEIVRNCSLFLKAQIKRYKPKVIVCNGAPVSSFMMDFLPPPPSLLQGPQTSYWSKIDDDEICVVLSGFIGRIDNYARRRLGAEIEGRVCESISRFNINPHQWKC